MCGHDEFGGTRIGHRHNSEATGTEDSGNLPDSRLDVVDVLENVVRESHVIRAVLNACHVRDALLELSANIGVAHNRHFHVNPVNEKGASSVAELCFKR